MKRFLCILILCALGLSACAAEPVRSAEETAALKKCFSLCGVYSGYVAVCRDYSGKPTHLIDETGEIVLTFSDWDKVASFGSRDFISVRDESGKLGFLNADGEWAVEPQYDYCYPLYDKMTTLGGGSLIGVSLDGKWGAYDRSGNFVISCEWDNIFPETRGETAIAVRDGTYYLLDPDAKTTEMLDLAGVFAGYENVDFTVYSDGLLPVRRDGKYGYLDLEGNLVIPCIYDYAQDFQNGAACAKLDGKYGLIDASGEVLLPFKFKFGTALTSDLFYFYGYFNYGENSCFVNAAGEYVFPEQPCHINVWDDPATMYAVHQDGQWGVINLQGEWIVPLQDCYTVCSGDVILMYEEVDGVKQCRVLNGRGEEILPLAPEGSFEVVTCGGYVYVLTHGVGILSIYDLDGNPVF